MSLDHRQVAATRAELAANLVLAGQSVADVAGVLGLGRVRVEAALAVVDAAPQDVWLVRDQLDRVIRVAGLTPHPYSSLTERARVAAQRWFPLVDVDDLMNGAAR